jgi:3-keto-disaccharide hydrolase
MRILDAPLDHQTLRMNKILFSTLVAASLSQMVFAQSEDGFVSLSDGKTFNGWKTATEHTDTWTVQDGAFVAHGDRCHLFYVGDEKPFKNFELKVDVMTEPHSNGGIYFHTKYQEAGWPTNGFECQVNVSHSDWKKTGSLYDVVNLGNTPAKDNEWWTQDITVQDNKVTVKINGIVVLEYTEPPGAQPGKDFTRKLASGTFALQGHDPKSVIRYKNIRVKRLD